jgi:predicted membrane protein
MAIIGGVLGFLLASALAVYGSRTFNNALVPVLSVFLVGLDFLLGAQKGVKNSVSDR